MLKKVKSLIGQRSPIRIGFHYCKALVAALCYGFPAKKLTIIGITGTDGKTTTVGMISHILKSKEISYGSISTTFIDINGITEEKGTTKTTVSPFVLQKFLRRLVKTGCTHAVIEYSSHGLVQKRTHFTWPKVVGITNTSMEHLDYHGTMEQYRKDKSLLFSMCKDTHVLNADDDTFNVYRNIPSRRTIVYALEPLHQKDLEGLWASDIAATPESTTATIHYAVPTETCNLTLNIPGVFNVENALCAIACTEAVGIDPKKSTAALPSFRGAVGRMERIDEGQPFSIFVDFTVSPNAHEKTISSVRAMLEADKKVFVLTGSCGDRMKEKRPEVGRICGELADVVVISTDETYTEDPLNVIEDVWAGIDQSKCEAHKIIDRKEAISFLIDKAEPGDAIVLCGMGSYPFMQTRDGIIPWNEQEIVRSLLQNN